MNKEKTTELLDYLKELVEDDELDIEVQEIPVDEYECDLCEDEYPNPLPDSSFAIMLADQYTLGITEAAKRLLRKMKNCSDELRIIFDIKLND